MYADQVTNSMQRAISETIVDDKCRCVTTRKMVLTQTIRKAVTDILSMIRPANSEVSVPKVNKEIYKASQSIYVTVLSI
ncbi:MAG: hypothetical protein CM15mP49_02340 [Actinomycetota bacterium]|nr:MAG: hypothetical protein CM15mP49_02340 [Actinomycetota bacterium]